MWSAKLSTFPDFSGKAYFESPTLADLFPAFLDIKMRGEISALAQETNPEIFYESLLQLGQRLELENQLEVAKRVYAAIGAADRPRDEISARAQARLNAMTGVGSSGYRAEFLLRHLARETMEPSSLVGMTAATAAFRMTRVASLSRLLASPTTNLATRGFGAQATASLLGFGVEATVFPLASRGAAAALGRDLDWSLHQVGREIAGSFLVLGAMKLTGSVVGRVLTRHADVVIGGARPALQQIGMFAGILLGHHLETAFGLRPHLDGATTFIDSLAMLIQFNAAGRLAHGIMGEGFRIWELGLDQQTRTFAIPSPFHGGGRPTWRPGGCMIPALAGAHIGSSLQQGRDKNIPDLISLSKGGFGEKSLDLPASTKAQPAVVQIEAALSRPHRLSALVTYSRLPENQIELALRRLRHAVSHSHPSGARGTYLNGIIRWALDEILRQEPLIDPFDQLCAKLYHGTTVLDFEQFIAKTFLPAEPHLWPSFLPPLYRPWKADHRRIRALPFDRKSKATLFRWGVEKDFLERLEAAAKDGHRRQALEKLFHAMAASPLGYARLRRLHRILKENDELSDSKIGELGDEDLHIAGVNDLVNPFGRFKSYTQWDAYLRDPRVLPLLVDMQQQLPRLLNQSDAARRREFALALLESSRKNTLPEEADILFGFDRLGDPFSKKIAAAIRKGEFNLELLPDAAFEARVKSLPDGDVGDQRHDAVYYEPGFAGEKALILLRNRPLNLSASASPPAVLFELLAALVQEYQHHLDTRPGESPTQLVHFRRELTGHAREFLWRAEFGDIRWLEEFQADGMGGFALHFRDKFEAWYSDWF